MNVAMYVVLVEQIEQLLESSLEPRLKCDSIRMLIRGAREDEPEPGADDDQR